MSRHVHSGRSSQSGRDEFAGTERDSDSEGLSGPPRLTILDAAARPASSSLIEKKSEFIGNAAHCALEAEAVEFVESVRLQHPKARHVAFAAVFPSERGVMSERMSDDGEPSGTAGKPILDALRKSSMTSCVVTVTRYFGGILLGSAGLIRAYSTAASTALRNARRARVEQRIRARVVVDYSQMDTFDHLLKGVEAVLQHRDYAERVTSEILVSPASYEPLRIQLADAFQGGVSPEKLGQEDVAIPLS
ncbi:MAG: IMPACT family protein [Bifidobacteriaceae bacterium]|jgi:uncharacterized YigZ family protein|nr:IMPACT family protein [Bifidobacteriaceae bacterium]MCI1979613.1 IMPACT family protein [Bifidobacteriaceae bacterium]